MNHVLAMFVLLLLPIEAVAEPPKFWVQSQITFGYGDNFITEKIKFQEQMLIENEVEVGRKFDLVEDRLELQLSYSFKNSRGRGWEPEHILGVGLGLSFPLNPEETES